MNMLEKHMIQKFQPHTAIIIFNRGEKETGFSNEGCQDDSRFPSSSQTLLYDNIIYTWEMAYEIQFLHNEVSWSAFNKISKFFSKNHNIELLWISLANKLKTITEIKLNDNNNSVNNQKESINNRETNDTSIPTNEDGNNNNMYPMGLL